jgi:hypothetical protein
MPISTPWRLGVDRTQVGYSYVGSGAVVMPPRWTGPRRGAEGEAALKAALGAQSPDAAVVGRIRGDPAWRADRCRRRPRALFRSGGPALPYGKTAGPIDEAVTEAALFEGMAPVLVVPETGHGDAVQSPSASSWPGTRAARPWSPPAARCPSCAGPTVVQITVIDPPPMGPNGLIPAACCARCWCATASKAEAGLRCWPRTLPRHLGRAGTAHGPGARDLLTPTLLVMGAYGHSRFREAILGGATRNMLEKAPNSPVFMAH